MLAIYERCASISRGNTESETEPRHALRAGGIVINAHEVVFERFHF